MDQGEKLKWKVRLRYGNNEFSSSRCERRAGIIWFYIYKLWNNMGYERPTICLILAEYCHCVRP